MSNEKHEPFTGVDRLELLGFEIIDLVSCGYKETISEIENQIENESIVQYIREKYKDNLSNTFSDNMPYNYADWNKALAKYSVWIRGRERRKYGIENEGDGLLLLLAFILELVANREHDWTGLNQKLTFYNVKEHKYYVY